MHRKKPVFVTVLVNTHTMDDGVWPKAADVRQMGAELLHVEAVEFRKRQYHIKSVKLIPVPEHRITTAEPNTAEQVASLADVQQSSYERVCRFYEWVPRSAGHPA